RAISISVGQRPTEKYNTPKPCKGGSKKLFMIFRLAPFQGEFADNFLTQKQIVVIKNYCNVY
ncbi:MAG: hypothetical protein LBE18_06865, partial [Planctomycetaceae bacterium]|nr:hypothetical protein [Planctomycetaceae bacterium]